MQEAYPFTVKQGKAKDKWDFLDLGAAVPAQTSRSSSPRGKSRTPA